MRVSLIWVGGAALALVVGCGEPGTAPGQAIDDASFPDAEVTDARVGSSPDATPLDAAPLDAAPLDAAPLDAAPLDAAPLDVGMAPDAAPADLGLDRAVDPPVDAAAPDAEVPDQCGPSCAPSACGPDGCGGQCGPCAAGVPCLDALCVPSTVRINEVVTANDESLVEPDGTTPDWVELYNSGPTSVALEGWGLTDDPDEPLRWRFPAVELPAGGYLVVRCSGESRQVPGEPLHTDFRLASAGEYLALAAPDGTVVDAYDPTVPALPDDHAHGVEQAVERVNLIALGSALRYRPAAPPDLSPAQVDFDDAEWPEAPAGLGFADLEAPDPEALDELAGGRPTSQSSTLGGFTADRAVNGDRGDFTHTAADDLEATWSVELDEAQWIGQIVLHNRQGCCGSRLRDILVEVLDGDGEVLWASPLLNPENALGQGLGGPPRLEVDLTADGGVVGQAVRVRRVADPDLSGTGGAGNRDEASVLSLGEVEVFGGAGEARALVTTDLDALRPMPWLWVRAPFVVEPDTRVDAATLQLVYDAGVILWLDGQPLTALDAPDAEALSDPETPWLAFDEPAGPRRATVAVPPALLTPGPHVLSVLVLDSAPDGADLLIDLGLDALAVSDGARRFFATPTPGGPNETPALDGFVAPVTFDPPRGFVDGPVEVRLASETPEAAIHYTLDGRAPTVDDPVYDPAIDGPIPVERITTIRAIALRDGFEPAPATAATYLFVDEIITEDAEATLARGFPPMWGGTAPDYGMDPRITGPDDAFDGRYAALMEASLRAIPSIVITADLDGLFGPDGIYTHSTRRGVAWERPISLEYIEPDGEGFQVECGLRVQGGAFRSHRLTLKHSFRVLFKRDYGPGKLRFPLFGPEASARLDGFTLRANSNDGWQWSAARSQPLFIRDSFGRETHLAMGGVSSHQTWAHLYINGVYWGLYNPVERPDASFGTHYLGGDRDAWDAVSNNQAADGDTEAWRDLQAMAGAGLATLDDLRQLEGIGPDGVRDPALPVWLDIDAYIDYMLVNIWGGNSDWPHKNWWIGRPRDGARGFRFFMWDSEWSIGLRSNLDTDKIGDGRGVAAPWNALLQNPEFQVRVADRVHRHWSPGGVFYVDPELPAWDPERPEGNVPAALFARLAAEIELPLVAESARWGDQHAAEPYTVDEHWAVERDRQLVEWFPERSARVLDDLRAAGLYPPTPAPLADPAPGRVRIGGSVTISAPSGAVWLTVDGPDPRLPGGEVDPAAIGGEAQAEVDLPIRPVTIRARVRDAEGWGPLFEGVYQAGG